MKEFTTEATLENIRAVTAFVDGELERMKCPLPAQMQINIAIDEIMGNIVHYAYGADIGPITVCVDNPENAASVEILFIDRGMPYNPLENREPDITLPVGEREIGGLGIFIVKKIMDEVSYVFKDGQNHLKIRKNIVS